MPESLELYFTDVAGNRWRVHDVVFGPPLAKPFKYAQLALGDQRASSRLFVPQDRDARLQAATGMAPLPECVPVVDEPPATRTNAVRYPSRLAAFRQRHHRAATAGPSPRILLYARNAL